MNEDELALHRIARIETRTVMSGYPRIGGENARRTRRWPAEPGADRYPRSRRGWPGAAGAAELALPERLGKGVSDPFAPTLGVTNAVALPLDSPLSLPFGCPLSV